MSRNLAAELKALRKQPDSEIDTSEAPEVLDWSTGVVGKFYRPMKKQVSIRLDLDILNWFIGTDKAGYQSRINDALRQYVCSQISKAPSPVEKRTAAKRAGPAKRSAKPGTAKRSRGR